MKFHAAQVSTWAPFPVIMDFSKSTTALQHFLTLVIGTICIWPHDDNMIVLMVRLHVVKQVRVSRCQCLPLGKRSAAADHRTAGVGPWENDQHLTTTQVAKLAHLRAPEDVPTSTAVGAARPRAQGQATTSTLHASCRLSRRPAARGLPAAAVPALCRTCNSTSTMCKLHRPSCGQL